MKRESQVTVGSMDVTDVPRSGQRVRVTDQLHPTARVGELGWVVEQLLRPDRVQLDVLLDNGRRIVAELGDVEAIG